MLLKKIIFAATLLSVLFGWTNILAEDNKFFSCPPLDPQPNDNFVCNNLESRDKLPPNSRLFFWYETATVYSPDGEKNGGETSIVCYYNNTTTNDKYIFDKDHAPFCTFKNINGQIKYPQDQALSHPNNWSVQKNVDHFIATCPAEPKPGHFWNCAINGK